MKELLQLYWIFFKIGATTFGGGYAMLPMLQREMIDNHHWATEEEILNYYAVGQCTPGIIMLNVATFMGAKKKGILGSIFASLGVVTPSIMIITIIAAVLTGFADNVYVMHALAGIRIVVCVLVLNAVLKLLKSGIKDWIGWCVFLAALLVMVLLSPSPVIVVVASGILGALLYGVPLLKKNAKEDGEK